MRFLSVCSGIEAASVAWSPLGWTAVAFSEIEKFPSAVLAHHYPDTPNLGDFTKIDTSTLGQVDILCGGTPCQAFSVAGLRNSLADARGNLTLSFVRLAHELAGIEERPDDGPVRDSSERQPAQGNGLRNAVWENVPGVLNTKDNAFGCFMGALVGADDALVPVEPKPAAGKSSKWWKWSKKSGQHQIKWPRYGMVSGPKGRAAWAVKDGQFFGLAQRRERVVLVADFGNGADPFQVLFEPESVPRDTPPSRETGQGFATDVAPSLVSSGREVERTGDTRGQDPVVATYAPEIARCDATREGSSQDYETTTMVAVGVTGDVAHTLKAEGADASEDGTGRGTPIIAQTVALRGREGGATAELGGEVATALRASSGGGDKPHVLAFNTRQDPIHEAECAQRLGAKDNGNGLLVRSAVRRLTPVECERLQGFPDNYTRIPWRVKPAEQCPDGPRYKALGNSWAVPKFAWLGRRLQALMPATQTNDNRTCDNQDARHAA